MYIHPFWCGVAATLICETVALVVATVWVSAKAKKHCGQCDLTDGTILTSDPPQVRCPVTGKFHGLDDVCDCNNGRVRNA